LSIGDGLYDTGAVQSVAHFHDSSAEHGIGHACFALPAAEVAGFEDAQYA